MMSIPNKSNEMVDGTLNLSNGEGSESEDVRKDPPIPVTSEAIVGEKRSQSAVAPLEQPGRESVQKMSNDLFLKF